MLAYGLIGLNNLKNLNLYLHWNRIGERGC